MIPIYEAVQHAVIELAAAETHRGYEWINRENRRTATVAANTKVRLLISLVTGKLPVRVNYSHSPGFPRLINELRDANFSFGLNGRSEGHCVRAMDAEAKFLEVFSRTFDLNLPALNALNNAPSLPENTAAKIVEVIALSIAAGISIKLEGEKWDQWYDRRAKAISAEILDSIGAALTGEYKEAWGEIGGKKLDDLLEFLRMNCRFHGNSEHDYRPALVCVCDYICKFLQQANAPVITGVDKATGPDFTAELTLEGTPDVPFRIVSIKHGDTEIYVAPERPEPPKWQPSKRWAQKIEAEFVGDTALEPVEAPAETPVPQEFPRNPKTYLPDGWIEIIKENGRKSIRASAISSVETRGFDRIFIHHEGYFTELNCKHGALAAYYKIRHFLDEGDPFSDDGSLTITEADL